MSDLLIKATPALLDGWCGPVVIDDGKTPAIHLGIQHPREGWVALGEISNHGLRRPVIEPVQQPVAAVQLDLSRAECRDRVARVRAGLTTEGALWRFDGMGTWRLEVFCG